jgi:hypothetical protein
LLILRVVDFPIDERDGVSTCARKPGVFVRPQKIENPENEFCRKRAQGTGVHSQWLSSRSEIRIVVIQEAVTDVNAIFHLPPTLLQLQPVSYFLLFSLPDASLFLFRDVSSCSALLRWKLCM